jgi:glycine/serine hydroxymethyltransferase
MTMIGNWIAEVISKIDDEEAIKRIKRETGELTGDFPVYPRLRNQWRPKPEGAY